MKDMRNRELGFFAQPPKNSCERVLAIFLWEHEKGCDSKCYTIILKIVIFINKYFKKDVITDYYKIKDF